MEWLQEPVASLSTEGKKWCPCMGAKCRGKCSPYGVCPAHVGKKCRQLSICLVYFN